MAALVRILLLCALVCLCSVVCHSPNHHRHNLVSQPDSTNWESIISSDAEATNQNSCCTRQQKIVQIGHGMLGYGVQLDVGRCEKNCHTSHLVERDSGDVDDNINEQVCPSDYSCLPSASTLHRVFIRSGMEEVSVIDACQCKETSVTCTRTDHVVLLYPGTPFETHLDVGACTGQCQKGGCRPIRNRTVSIPSPAGSSCHSIVEECGCAPSCYRISSEETVYDYSNADNGTDDAEPELKLIDVGMCVGSCSGERIQTRKCLLRDHRNQGRCLTGLYSKHTACSPVAFRLHSYVTKERQTKEVAAITACKCV